MAQKINFWRKPYEIYSVTAIFLLAIINFVFARTSGSGLRILVTLSAFMLILGAYRFAQYLKHVNMQAKLLQHPKCEEPVESIMSLVESTDVKDPIFIGYGFEWEQSHSQSLREIVSVDAETIRPPKLLLDIRKALGFVNDREMHGKAYFHGLGLHEEKPIFVSAGDFGAHSFIAGTTGAGKSTFYQLLIRQMIYRDEAIIILDPKGDDSVRNAAYGTLKALGKAHKFHYFSPSNYTSSVRINPMKNFSRPSQLADRIASILPSGGDAETFKQFVNQHLAILTDSIMYCGESVSLKSYKHYCSGGLDGLVVNVLESFLRMNSKHQPKWENSVSIAAKKYANLGHNPKQARALALVAYYNGHVSESLYNPIVTSLIGIFEKEKSHYDKLIATLMPVLQKLATGNLGTLLSPDYDDVYDTRPIVDLDQICQKGDVLYVNMESLADGSTGSALGSLLLSDMTSVAAKMYLFNRPRAVNVFADEVAEQINDPFIQQLNKSRGAGFRVFAATQTISDITVKMGSQAHADMVIGNTNNKFYLRLKDSSTREAASMDVGQTMLTTSDRNISTTGYAPGENMDYGGGYGKRESKKLEYMIEPEQFGKIPDLEFFACLLDGRTLKVRMPYIHVPKQFEFNPLDHQYAVPFAA